MADIIEMMLVPTVILVTAIGAWRVQISVMARRASWDFIANHEQSGEWINLSKEAEGHLTKEGSREGKPRQDWEKLAARWSTGTLTDHDKEKMNPILLWLNRQEFVAIAILDGTMHMGLYAKWWGWEYIEQWGLAKGFVEALRATDKGDKTLFRYFQDLAESEKFRRLSQRPSDR